MAKKLFDTPDVTNQMDPEDIELNNRLSLLAYLGILVLIPIFLIKHSRYAKFHANQGLVLIIVSVVSGIVFGLINFVGSLIGSGIAALLANLARTVDLAFIATVGTVIAGIISVFIGILSCLVSLMILFLTVVGIIYAVKGRAKELPLIGRFHLLKY